MAALVWRGDLATPRTGRPLALLDELLEALDVALDAGPRNPSRSPRFSTHVCGA
jgi:hypothetical protein